MSALDDYLTGTGLFYNTALNVGADQTYVTPLSESSQPTNAVDAMQPVGSVSAADAFGWVKSLANTVVGYSIAKDAQQNRVQPPQVYAATAAQAQGYQVQQAQSGNLLVILLVVGGLIYALKD